MNIKDFKKQISVVIQGPLDNRTYEAIDCYQDYGQVIVSTWSTGEDFSYLSNVSRKSTYDLATCHYPPNMKDFYNPGAAYYISRTTLNGSKIARCPFVLKTRTDELYPNLDVFLENVILHPDKFHTTDNGFWKHHDMCCSCHLFLATTQHIVNHMDLITRYCEGEFNNMIKPIPICESIFGLFMILTKNNGILNDNLNWKEEFRKHLFITPCDKLPGHMHSGQSSFGRGFKRSTDLYPCGRKEVPSGCHDKDKLYRNVEDII